MPELPEVETTLRGIRPHVLGRVVERVVIRQPRLRWPVPACLRRRLPGNAIDRVERRAKYLLLGIAGGTVILHLGMSGHLRVLDDPPPPGPHDHVDIVLEGGRVLRLTDPRRFGAVLWAKGDAATHPLIAHLGPEPLDGIDGRQLWERAQGRKVALRDFLLDGRVIAGVGNIYANEALFVARIDPSKPANRLTGPDHERLLDAIRGILGQAIRAEGTTIRDYRTASGRPGTFQTQLFVYGREGVPCRNCDTPLASTHTIDARSTVFCFRCQR